MAKPDAPKPATEAAKPKRAARPPVDKDVRKCANLLKEISGVFKDGSDAMMKGDTQAAFDSVELSRKYLELFFSLAKKMADDETADGLVAAQEM